MSPQHTPTPRQMPLSVYHDSKSICNADGHVMTVESEGATESEDREFAAFIVLACNSHEQLVAALQLARKHLDIWIGAMHETIDCSDDVDALAQIDAALAAAQVKP